jgi:CBS domain-containing protein
VVLDVPAGTIARRNLITVDENGSVLEAARLMKDNNRGSVLATRSGEPIGILTERDILRKVVANNLGAASTKVKDVMTSPPTTIDRSRPLREAIDLMVRKGLRRMLVTEDGRIVGIFTMRDVLKHTRTCQHCGKEIRSILESQTPDPFIECECGSRYHTKCAETVVNCVACGRTIVTNVIYPEPADTSGG